MKRMFCSLCLLLALVVRSRPASAAVGDQLLRNGSLEAARRDEHGPGRVDIRRGATTTPTSRSRGRPTPTRGNHSAKVEVSGYTDGDSKWVPDMVPVTGGAYYTFSDWYKSNASTAVSVYYELDTDTDTDSDGLIDGHWANLFSGIAPASEWTQYKTGFTMPAGAVRAQFVHFIARNGWLQTDDYSLTEEERRPASASR